MNRATETSVGKKHNGMDHQATPEEIERALAQTRADLNDTLNAIEHRLSPGELMDQAIDYFRGGPREFVDNLGAQMRDNPLPVALMAVSIGWLMLSTRRDEGYTPQYTSEGIAESGPGIEEKGRAAYGSAVESMQRTGAAISEKSAEMRERVGERMSHTREEVGRTSETMRHRARTMAAGMRRSSEGMASGIRQSGEKARDTFSYLLNEQPLVLGALGIALGAALGSGLSTTRREREAMAPARDVVNRTWETGREQMEKSREDLKQAVSEPAAPSGSPT